MAVPEPRRRLQLCLGVDIARANIATLSEGLLVSDIRT